MRPHSRPGCGSFPGAAANAETTLFFYAGHGLQVDGQNYLVPVDAELAEEVDLRWDAVPLGNVIAEMRSEVNLVFLDACRDNPLARNLAGSMGSSRSAAVGRGLGRVESRLRDADCLRDTARQCGR